MGNERPLSATLEQVDLDRQAKNLNIHYKSPSVRHITNARGGVRWNLSLPSIINRLATDVKAKTKSLPPPAITGPADASTNSLIA